MESKVKHERWSNTYESLEILYDILVTKMTIVAKEEGNLGSFTKTRGFMIH